MGSAGLESLMPQTVRLEARLLPCLVPWVRVSDQTVKSSAFAGTNQQRGPGHSRLPSCPPRAASESQASGVCGDLPAPISEMPVVENGCSRSPASGRRSGSC